MYIRARLCISLCVLFANIYFALTSVNNIFNERGARRVNVLSSSCSETKWRLFDLPLNFACVKITESGEHAPNNVGTFSKKENNLRYKLCNREKINGISVQRMFTTRG